MQIYGELEAQIAKVSGGWAENVESFVWKMRTLEEEGNLIVRD